MGSRVKFWMVWRASSNSTRYQHTSKKQAVLEAKRLSEANPCEVFYVLKSTEAFITETRPTERIKLVMESELDDGIPF